ncbi:hypothetical protein L4X63_11995 [Geomonas sp. Red32]|uniref:DUF6538 domain-containing protein n=1 Tax=Geomonas sp. Red32 TaxID=2912856 RepID=UPI00202D0CB3|nr:DUF6538 domain-containing protein [Geomonas sp. Red32]MCM0082311.1 hypothetical protein [Geomonas sp. Red32]
MDYMRRRGKTYCVVITVPIDLQPVVGKRQIWRSLKTRRYQDAKSAARKLLSVVDGLFNRMRNGMDQKLIDSMVAEYGLGTIAAQDKARLGVKVSDDPEYNAFMLYRADLLRSLKNPEVVGSVLAKAAAMYQREEANGNILSTPFATEAADMMLSHYNKQGLVGGPDEVTKDEFTEVVAAFAVAERHLFKVESERVLGITEDDSDYQYRLLRRWRSNLPVRKDPGIPFSELRELYHAEWSKTHAPDRARRKAKELERIERVFAECFGEVPRVRAVTPEMALEWRDYYQHEFYNEREPLENKSVDNALETLSAVFNWGANHKVKYTEGNPFRGLGLPSGVACEKSRIFESRELQAYFDLLADLHNPQRPELTWIPLVIAYSGLRCNEVAQLFVDDVQEREGILFFRVTGNEERHQRTKTEESKRNVPVHRTLRDLGLVGYVRKMQDMGESQLFPNLKWRESCGLYYDANASSLMNSPVNLISNDSKLRLYSLRANFRCSVEEALIAPALASHDRGEVVAGEGYSPFLDLALNNVMGHRVKGNTGDTVYRKRQLGIMNKVVQLAAYPVDLSRLKAVLVGD